MRYVLLDRLTELTPGRSARGIKCVSLAEDVFEHHFPGHPLFPGALLVESMAQVGGVLLEATLRQQGQHGLHALLVSIDRAQFRHPVRPGEKLVLHAQVLHATEDGGRIEATAQVEDRLVAKTQLTFAFARVTSPPLLETRRQVLCTWLYGEAHPSHPHDPDADFARQPAPDEPPA